VTDVPCSGDRFVEGNIAGAFESGFLAAIARRARELATEADRQGSHRDE
jgi:hypothetical protein